jgi:hypothetical protein
VGVHVGGRKSEQTEGLVDLGFFLDDFTGILKKVK